MKHESRYERLREKTHEVIFEADTFWGKTFDVVLLVAIVLSVIAVMLESVLEIRLKYGNILFIAEWIFTALFTVEYIARLWSVNKPWKYATSFYGVIDLLSILPAFIALFISGAQAFLILRSIRLIRVFRVFKLVRFLGEASVLKEALRASRAKIIVFVGSVFIMVVILGTMMYIIEGGENGFTSIPKSIYWAVVTLTTVGYGDIAPQTPLGQGLATLIMILGYGIIAVPTGIVTSEMAKKGNIIHSNTRSCQHCGAEEHSDKASYCYKCGSEM
ncbi:ion transporter [Fulvivirga sedimenti]|uniref:Ion transporter n=1 Tax=Fulvivirga sedimenti TaxID=2879465 RepID=A0A9X1HT21_9BACT|nr:ion transporter [Fulvivirga sedimenti]MCA6075558.1 ion transporter [Fulvivirga sedimenti]MCA6076735.1 ion transporter [Fulvivirga sedimenti]MCA6077863.1 ion transporter [Fulvivirga sedimenti]